MPASDTDVFEDETHQLLTAFEAEGVDAEHGLLSEVGDALVEAVFGGQLGLASDEGLAFLVEATTAVVDLACAAAHFCVVDHSGLVEVGDPSPFGMCTLEPAVESGQLGGEELVVGSWGLSGQGCFSGSEELGTGEQLAYLVENEGVEFVGPDTPLGAAAVGSAGPPGVAMRAEVVAGRCLAVPGPVADELDPTGRAAQKPSQKEGFGFGVPGTVDAVVPGFGLNSLKDVLVDDGRDGDLDPLLAWPEGLAVLPQGRVVAGLGAVPIQPTDVGLIPGFRSM